MIRLNSGSAYAKFKMSIFKSKIQEFVGIIDIIPNDFQSLIYLSFLSKIHFDKKNLKIPGIQPKHDRWSLKSRFKQIIFANYHRDNAVIIHLYA